MLNNRVFLGTSVQKVLLDSVIVGKLNHDLRVQRKKGNLGPGDMYGGLNQDSRIKKIKMSTMYGTNSP